MLCAFQSEVAGTDHSRELALKIVLTCGHRTRRPATGASDCGDRGAPPRGHDVIELIIARADTPVRHEVALDGIGHVPRWMYGSSPSATTNGGLDVVLSDAGVDHACQVAGGVYPGGQPSRLGRFTPRAGGPLLALPPSPARTPSLSASRARMASWCRTDRQHLLSANSIFDADRL